MKKMELRSRQASRMAGERVELPDEFIQYTRNMMGGGLFEAFADALSEAPPVSIRLNPAKCIGRPDAVGEVAWCRHGYYLADRPNFTFDPLLHAGWYYVQEASSMFLHHVITKYVDRPVAMLDLCAAPGGKSTAALAALPEGSVLVSNEPIRQRAQVLMENIQKWGCPDVIVTNNYPHDYAASGLLFDVVLCDVPCSGEGMFRKDAGSVGEWSWQNVEACSRLQREIVASAWRCLRPGGLLVYSTCTFNIQENEENVRWIATELGADVLPVETEKSWGIRGSLLPGFDEPVCRFIPGCTRGEGLFLAVMRKRSEAAPQEQPLHVSTAGASQLTPAFTKGKKKNFFRQPGRPDTAKNSKSAPSTISLDRIERAASSLLERVGEAGFIFRQSAAGVLMALPQQLSSFYDMASLSLRILSAGVTVGRLKGRDLIPDQALALSTSLRRDAFPRVSVDYGQAVAYLRRESISLPDGAPRGIVLLTYRGAALGFAKNIGSRANNLYPQEWKIKSGYAPDSQPEIIV